MSSDPERPFDTRQAEKDYLRRSNSLPWERVKPFSPPATDTLGESVRLIHDFAVAVQALEATLGQLIVDLGAGSGWTSEWLRRLNLDVVSVDISHDMLAVARGRMGAAALVNGDFESLPFASGVFDRALCMNALHHVPDPGAALREIFRILGPRGRLVLVEPGSGHGSSATSQIAVAEFGVLEQDLEAADLMRLCVEAGFGHVTVRPLSYATGEIELTLDDLSRWRKWSRTRRPVRAAAKVWRALLEAAGAGKKHALFEDALGIWITRVLARHVSEQAVVVASKGPQRGLPHFRGRIRLEAEPRIVPAAVVCRLTLHNTGAGTWRAHAKTGRVQLGVQLLDEAGVVLDRDYYRVALPHDLPPDDQCQVEVEIPFAPGGQRRLARLDAVAEDIAWLELDGPDPIPLTPPRPGR